MLVEKLYQMIVLLDDLDPYVTPRQISAINDYCRKIADAFGVTSCLSWPWRSLEGEATGKEASEA